MLGHGLSKYVLCIIWCLGRWHHVDWPVLAFPNCCKCACTLTNLLCLLPGLRPAPPAATTRTWSFQCLGLNLLCPLPGLKLALPASWTQTCFAHCHNSNLISLIPGLKLVLHTAWTQTCFSCFLDSDLLRPLPQLELDLPDSGTQTCSAYCLDLNLLCLLLIPSWTIEVSVKQFTVVPPSAFLLDSFDCCAVLIVGT
jgi:hypothetical protein